MTTSSIGPGAGAAGRTGRLELDRLPVPLLGLAMIASGALQLAFSLRLTFQLDDWAFVLYRSGGGVGSFLDPHNEHIVLIPVSIYKLLMAVFGMSSADPYHVLSTIAFLISVAVLFQYLRARVGDWLALFGCCLILFLGAAWEDLLWSFQIGFFGCVAAGIGALLALERDDRTGDGLAALLLTVSIAFSTLGLSFLVGAAVAIGLDRARWRRSAFAIVVPLVLYAAWWLGWGRQASNDITLHNVATTPRYVLDSLAAAAQALAGFDPSAAAAARWGPTFLLVIAAAAAYELHRRRHLPKSFLIAAAVGLTFWVLAGFEQDPGRAAVASRYQYPSAVFVLMILAGVYSGARPRREALAVAAVLTGCAMLGGASLLHGGYQFFKANSDSTTAKLTAIEMGRDHLKPDLLVDVSQGKGAMIDADTFLSVADDHGAPIQSRSALAADPAPQRDVFDTALADGLGLSLTPYKPAAATGPGCRRVEANTLGYTGLAISDGVLRVRPARSAEAALSLGKYGDGYPVELGSLAAGRTYVVGIPPDSSGRPWRIGLAGSGRVRVCGAGAGAG